MPEAGGCKEESRVSPQSNGLIVDRREHRVSFMLSDPREELRVRWLRLSARNPPRVELPPSSDRESVSARLCTPYMLSLGPSDASGEGLRSGSEACGLRDRKKVAGAAVRGSKEAHEEDRGSVGLRGKAGTSGTGRIVETFEGVEGD